MSAPAPQPVVVHGIANCDQVRRARDWLGAQGIAHRFRDFRRTGLAADELAGWIGELGWESLLNRRGTTWRKLDDAARAAIVDGASAAELMQAHPSVIRRPVVRWHDGEMTVGFDPTQFARRAAA